MRKQRDTTNDNKARRRDASVESEILQALSEFTDSLQKGKAATKRMKPSARAAGLDDNSERLQVDR
jgi:hypothetical protein